MHPYPDPDDNRRRHDERHGAKNRQRQAALRETRWDLPLARPGPAPRRSAPNTQWDMPAARDSSRWAQEPGRRHRRPSRNPDDDDAEFAKRQFAGLMVLMSIAEPETRLVPFSGTAVHLRYTGPIERPGRLDRQPPKRVEDTGPPPGRLTALWAFIRTDQMLRNSLYLILNMGVQAALGFGFWIIAARFFSTTSIGQASSLISASTLISFSGLLGLNTALVKFLPTSRQRNRLITAGLTIVATCSTVVAVFYVLLMPLLSKPISFVAHSLPLAIGFIVLTAAGGINLLTDSVFIAAGKSNYTAVVDGIVGGVAKIALIVVFAGAGAYAVFGAAAGGFLASAVASILLIAKVLHWRPVFGGVGHVLKPILSFSGMNYVGNILNLLPTLVVPLIVVSKVGTSEAAYYYVSFQLASLLYSAAYSVENAFLAEGSQSATVSRAILMRSARILIALCASSFVVVLLFGHLMLSAFGAKYGSNAESSLVPLTAAVLPIGAYYWCLTVLRLSNQLRAVVWCNVVYAAAIIGLAFILAPRGLEAVAMAWPIGTTIGTLVAGGAVISSFRRKRSLRHSRGQHVVTG
jgi:O-antigen/teichoic acid export membrane protein